MGRSGPELVGESQGEPVVRATMRGRVAVSTFLAGNAVSVIGNTLMLVALPWFVLETTGSAGRTGLVAMAAALPALVSGLFGGVLVDRLGGRTMSVISDVLNGIAVALIPALYLTVGLNFTVFMVLVFLGAILDIPGITARRTLLPELAREGGIRPEAINSAYETMQSSSFILGPVLAGVLIALIGTVNLLWVTAAGFILSAILIGLFSPAGKFQAAEDDPYAATGAIAEIRAGLQYLRADALLLWLAIGLTVMNLLHGPYWSVVLPVMVSERFGEASQLGLLFTAMGIGGVIGGVLYGWLGHRTRRWRRVTYLGGVTAFCGLVWLSASNPVYWVLLAGVFLIGVVSGPINPLLVTVRMERIPEALRGRVFATFSGLASAAIPVGMLVSGWVLEVAGLQTGLLIGAVATTAATIVLWLVPAFRAMDVRDAPAEA